MSNPTHRPSSARPSSVTSTTNNNPPTNTRTTNNTSLSASTINRNRQYTHLHAQLAQLNAHMADLENLVGMTAVQAEYMRGLGGWWGGAFMAASKVLGEETAEGAGAGAGAGAAAREGERGGQS